MQTNVTDILSFFPKINRDNKAVQAGQLLYKMTNIAPPVDNSPNVKNMPDNKSKNAVKICA